MYTCASCTLRSCQKGGGDLPRNCPMRDPEFFDRLLERYWSEENHDFLPPAPPSSRLATAAGPA